jgi:hypothetical protein
MENIKKVLKAAGTSLENVIKVNIFVSNLGDFQALNEVYAEVSYCLIVFFWRTGDERGSVVFQTWDAGSCANLCSSCCVASESGCGDRVCRGFGVDPYVVDYRDCISSDGWVSPRRLAQCRRGCHRSRAFDSFPEHREEGPPGCHRTLVSRPLHAPSCALSFNHGCSTTIPCLCPPKQGDTNVWADHFRQQVYCSGRAISLTGHVSLNLESARS